jgi:G3E family GTPase
MIPLLVGAAAGGLVNLWANHKAGEAREEAERQLEESTKQQKDLITNEYSAMQMANEGKSTLANQEYTIESNKNFLDRSEAQNVLAKLREQNKQSIARSENMAAITGGSEEAMLAEKANIQENTGDVMQNLASGADQYKERIKSTRDAKQQMYDNIATHLAQGRVSALSNINSNYANAKIGLAEQKAQGWAQLGQNLGSVFSTGGAMLDGGGDEVANLSGLLLGA